MPWLTLRYWWPPLALLAVAAAVLAWLHPYRPVLLEDIPAEVRAATARLDKLAGPAVASTFLFTSHRSFVSKKEPVDVEIHAKLEPMGDGLVMRQDDWYETGERSAVYQERYVMYRNLFSVHTRSRDIAPVMKDLLGRVGWYNDSARTLTATQKGASPQDEGWALDVRMDRTSDNENSSGITQATTSYQRTIACVRSGTVEGPAVGKGLEGTYPKVTCRQRNTDQSAERVSDYAWLPRHGIFLLLGYQQQGADAESLEATGTYDDFKVVAAP
ncbi:MAG: hypothetical protein ABW051_09210 [Burkholderiaceae bacterium]